MVAASPAASGLPRISSRSMTSGGRRLAKVIGLTLIQNIASRGKSTTSATEITVGASRPQAKRASYRARGPAPRGGVGETAITSTSVPS